MVYMRHFASYALATPILSRIRPIKQVLQSLKTGATDVVEVPMPSVSPGSLLIASTRTLISPGTERMLVGFGKAGLLGKARQQPDKVRQVIEKVRTDGLASTASAVLSKLDQPVALGYCNVGRVIAVGAGVSGFAVGDRVASNGKHAEIVSVPKNLCVRVPDSVSDDEAAFTVIGAVSLQGIRLAQATLGESVVVLGLGLLGQLAVQLLRAQGCRVLGADFDIGKLQMAREFGAEVVDLSAGTDVVEAAVSFSRGRGVDAVIITAATESSAPVRNAAQMCRQRGRIVLVGVAGLELSRDDFYKKELSFQVSASYGPGRYDANYEEKGNDYPVGFVRWTAQRNFEAVLDAMATRALTVDRLISHRFHVDDASLAYDLITSGSSALGVVLDYPGAAQSQRRTVRLGPPQTRKRQGSLGVSIVGSGNYAGAILVPAFRKAGASFRFAVSQNGMSSVHLGRKFGFVQATTECERVFEDGETEAVVITTRHDSHAELVIRALEAGKHVFVEKPLCLSLDELQRIEQTVASQDAAGRLTNLMIGFNRRFAPHVVQAKRLLARCDEPKAFIMTVNAGALPEEHWTQATEVGGGRILGEACHFIDLLRFLACAPISRHSVATMKGRTRDTATIQLEFADGSIGTINYFANGSRTFPKERLEVFAGQRILQLDNYRKLIGFGWPGVSSMRSWRQDKGQTACAAAFVAACEGALGSPIPFEEIVEVSRVSIEIAESMR